MSDATFRPHERMRNPKDFRRAFERRKTASDDILIVYAASNGLPYSRLGISVGKKKVKSAAGRNRIKRTIREAFRLNRVSLPQGVDLVIVPRGGVVRFDRAMASLPVLARGAARRLEPRTGPGIPRP
ncbi:MAG: rnpA [Planctomycetota bacterium]|nr:rnpA [Planctomycetota bacterium]